MAYNFLPEADLKVRGVYELYSRNIFWGVFDGTGFIGLRHKFEWRIDKEHLGHTVRGALQYICQLPDEIELVEGWRGPDTYTTNERLLGYLLRVQETTKETPYP